MNRIPDGMILGPYLALVDEVYRTPAVLAELARFGEVLRRPGSRVISSGRNRNVRLRLAPDTERLDIVAKIFPRQSPVKDLHDRLRGSPARRAWNAARILRQRGVATPAPVAALERWRRGRLVENYFLSEYAGAVTTFTEELVRLYRREPDCVKFMALMACVADAIRALHSAGFRHNDLGNQNILLRRTGPAAWTDAQFIDLNRAKFLGRMGPRDRARDISRISLPSDLLRIFKEMYYGDTPPQTFQNWERRYRRAYAFHTRSRRFRHPLQYRRRVPNPDLGYPPEKDMWIWDDKSCQPIVTLRPKDRARLYPPGKHVRLACATIRALGPVWRRYGALLKESYGRPVNMDQRIGVAVEPTPETMDRQRQLLESLGRPPVLIRFYCHDTDHGSRFRSNIVRTLHKEGLRVAIALVQDRRAVKDPTRWERFVEKVLEASGTYAEWIEVGHATNRVKWGIWDFSEYRRLTDAVIRVAQDLPGLRLMGPAAIDFDIPFVCAALSSLSKHAEFGALSHHMYVDRRGAPENRQGPFATLEKLALARAVAQWSPVCEDRLIVSEVNWPLRGTGVYSPVNSPYESPGPRVNDPGVEEDRYADYMLRYLAMGICSGLVERIYWWRLVARGFGLVDDTRPEAWRERPAFRMLKQFLSLLGAASFTAKLRQGEGLEIFAFQRENGERVCLAYSPSGRKWQPEGVSRVLDALGQPLPHDGPLNLSGRPVYVFFK